MTCASCAARITKRLNKLDGVDATVNYATEQATVTLPDALTLDEVVAQVVAVATDQIGAGGEEGDDLSIAGQAGTELRVIAVVAAVAHAHQGGGLQIQIAQIDLREGGAATCRQIAA